MIDYRQDNHWTVYIHIVPKELSGYQWDKYYVGVTSQTPQKRWKNGFGYKKNQVIYKAIQKYGWNNIHHEIFATNLTEQEAKNMEIKLITSLNCNMREFGYNRTSGGDGHSGDINIKKKNFIGHKFGELTIIEDLPDKSFSCGQKQRMELCMCSCGKKIPVLLNNLIKGNTMSCGHNGRPNRRIYNHYDLFETYGIGYTQKKEKFYFDLEDYNKIKGYCWRIDTYSHKLISEKCIPKSETFNIIHILFDFSKSGKPINIVYKNHNIYDFRKSNIIFVPPKGMSLKTYMLLLKADSRYISWNSQEYKWQVKIANKTKSFTNLDDAILYRNNKLKHASSFLLQ